MAEQRRKRAAKKKAADKKRQGELFDVFEAARDRFGAMVVRAAGDVNQPLRIPTGIFMLDFALLGGIPHNRASMFAGRKHAGKSMLASLLVKGAQDSMPDHECVVIDVEGTFEAIWAKKLGVDLDRLHIVYAETGEMAVDLTEAILASQETSLVVVDSLAAMTPTAEIEEDADKQFYALQARLIKKMVNKATHVMIGERKRDHFVTLLYLNQLRARIGGPPKASPFIIPGGHALEHSTSIQGLVKNREIKDKTDDRGIGLVVENQHSFSLDKNKLNNGPRAGDFFICRMDRPEKGLTEGMVDDAHTLIAYAKKMGFWSGAGKNQKLTIGDRDWKFSTMDQASTTVTGDRELYAALRKQLLQEQAAHLGMKEAFIRTIV